MDIILDVIELDLQDENFPATLLEVDTVAGNFSLDCSTHCGGIFKPTFIIFPQLLSSKH